ncbi:uncharacterized protein TrAFT101_006904 [Trichoderma asperellum]|uniref:DNA/RNA-binding protein Alba-like domain-containing protein n=1 Tax=Trichoderma asperellum (strain ATCC 204424 / CBS 433.97 / NBRC 101777) TaxID=1042311 RepID=A0A2T3Z254_TRIA4|nr:hypothetical protein M441DRAFT_240599 [Trichoderma asperellum CBS 433.97]PTB38877.1 hypothetical protein M441DRAFT_240599 [Trichoderma asperellum CBS 433.97]UKZ91935.1 hypothetical protein TrAFT101_006904 [Trichoderma asperellum]
MSADNPSKKRKQQPASQPASSKKSRTEGNATLIGPHEGILKELSTKHNVLALSIISSTQIRKRVSSATSHLLDKTSGSRAVLLHARPADVCKMMTVAEQCKRTLGEQGRTWYQYNELFDLPAETKKKKTVPKKSDLEEVEDDGSDSDDNAFETMQSRFEQAVLPPPRAQTYKSLRIFISSQAISDLKSRENVTVQTSEDAT